MKEESHQVHRSADEAGPVHGLDRFDGLGERRIEKSPSLGFGAPHQALRDAAGPHRDHVDQDPDRAEIEVGVGEALAVQLGAVQPWDEPIEHPGGHESVPPKATTMGVANDPIGVVGQRVDRTDREQGTFEGGHAVERDAGREELEDRVGPELVPRSPEGQEAV